MGNKTFVLVLFVLMFFSLSSNLASAAFDIPSDYISWWRFEGNANDQNGINNGTVSGATYNATGKFGGDYEFNGVNDYISIADSNSVNLTGNFTISLWVKTSNSGSQDLIRKAHIFNSTNTGINATASSQYSDNAPSKLFDNSIIGSGSTGWGNNNIMPSWLVFNFTTGSRIITKYRFICASGQAGGWGSEAYNPKTWVFWGYNGSTWIQLDSISDGLITMDQWKDFSINNTASYSLYRWNISVAESGSWVHATELQFQYPDYGYILQTDNGKIRYDILNNDSNSYLGSTTINNDLWHHILINYNGSTIVSYVDGSQDVSFASNGSGSTSGIPFYIGGSSFYFNGSIDEVIIYNRSLSAAEITQLYNMQVTDTVYPTFSAYSDNNASLTSSGTGLFNVTLANTNGTVLLEINNQNYTATNLTANVYNVSVSLTNGTYSYKWHSWGNGTSHLYNFSDTRSYTINNSDTTYPIFSNNLTSIANGSQHNSSNNYQFNITIANTNGTAGIEFNNVNYTLANISNSFYWNVGSLGAGTYNYYFWSYGNGASHNYNTSQTFSYTITKAVPQGILTNTTSWTITYPTSVTIGLSESNLGDGDVNYMVYRDNTDKGTGETITLGAGTYNYILNATGGQNYTSNSSMDAKTLVVNKNTSTQTSLTFDKTSPQSYTNSITPTCSVITGQGTPVLSLNGTIITSGSPITLGVGTWQFNCSLADNGNYSYAENITNFQITQNNSYVLSLSVNPSWNVNYGTQTNVSGNGCPSQLTCNLYNNASGAVSNSINLTLGAGSYNFTYNTTGNANYSSMSVSNILIVSQANGYINLSLNGAENNLTLTYPQQINITALNLYGNLIIYKDGVDITSTNGANQTYGYGYYNITAYSSGNENYTSSYKTFWLNITKATPTITTLLNGVNNNLTVVYPQQVNASGSTTGGTLNIYRDGNLITHGINYSLGVGYYRFYFNVTGDENYTNASIVLFANVTKATQSITPLLNGNNANLIVAYPQQINASYSGINYTTLSIKINDTSVNIGQNYTWQTGSWIVNYSASENENYSGFNSLLNLTISKGNSIVYTHLNNSRSNITITAGNSVDRNSSLISGEGIIKLYVNGSLINSGNSLHNSTLFDSVGLFNITTIYEETQNYSASSETFFINVTDLIFPSIYYNNGTETSGSNLNRNNIVVNVTALDLESGLKNITIFLYNSTSLINSSNSTLSPLFVNFTNLTDGIYYFNATAYDNAGNKNETETRTITIDTVNPSLILLSPLDNSWDSDGNLTFVYNVTDTNNITNCALTLNNVVNLTNSSVIKGVNNSFQLNDLEAGKYNWSINCLDVAGNINASGIKSFSVILMSEFLGGDTTNLSNMNISNITNLVIDNPLQGKINFSQEIDLSGGADVNRNVNISFNRIEINSSELPQLNKSARLYLYNLTFTTPRILKDGEVCPESICKQESYLNGTLIFNVSSFSVYSAEETPIVLQPPSGGGSGGGGGAIRQECIKDDDCNTSYSCFNNKCVKLFDVKIIRIDSPIAPGDFLDFSYFVKGMADIKGDVVIDFWLEKDNKTITTGKDTIYFGTFEEKTETTSMFLSSDIKEGTYTFFVQTDYQGHKTYSQRDIEVVKMPTSNLDVNLLSFPSVKEGQAANFSFIVGFNKDSPVSVKLKETIKKGEEIVWENGREMEVNRSVILNEQTGILKTGDYRFEINAEYENKQLKFLYDFSVGKKMNYWWFLLLIPIALLLIMFIIWRRNAKKQKTKLEEALKQQEIKTEGEVKTEEATTGIQEPPTIEQKTFIETAEQPETQETIAQEQTTEESSEINKEKSFYQSVTQNSNDEVKEETKYETEESLNKVIGLDVYSDDEKIGVVEGVYTEDSETYTLLVKLEEKIAKESGHEKILIKNKYIINIGDIIITDERVVEHLRRFDDA